MKCGEVSEVESEPCRVFRKPDRLTFCAAKDDASTVASDIGLRFLLLD